MEHAQTKTSLPARRRHIRKISVFPLINGLLFTIICLLILVPLWKVLVDSFDSDHRLWYETIAGSLWLGWIRNRID